MMTSKKPRLHKATYDDKEQLRISGKSLFSLFFLVIMFFIFAFIVKGPTYGFL